MRVSAESRPALASPIPIPRIKQMASGRGWRTGAKIVVSAGLLVWLLSRINLSDAPVQIGFDWTAVVLVWMLQSALPFVQAQRWRLIAATLGARLPFTSAIANVYIGQFFNQVLPSSIGGDAVRVWRLARLMPVPVALSSVALDRVMALLAVPIMLMIGSGMLARIMPAGPLRWSLFAIIAAAACGLVAFLWADRIPLPGRVARSRLIEIGRATSSAARRLFAAPGCLARTVLLSITIHVGVGTSLWMLARALGVEAPLSAFLLLAPLITMVTTIPISIGGWGVREGAMVTALSLLDVQPSIALAISIQFGLIMMVVGLPGGAIMLFSSAPKRAEAAAE
jgi:uncharacterized membrane protein YbhN (UPF0104 family)